MTPVPQPTRCRNTVFQWGSRTYVMGIINVTPDSFSGDGLGTRLDLVLEQARRFVAEGADILDVGGESTRPGHVPVAVDEELRRVVPAIRVLRAAVSIPISIDTYKVEVAQAAVEAGADMLNDIWGLRRGPGMARLAAQRGIPIVLMHNQEGTDYPSTGSGNSGELGSGNGGGLVEKVVEGLRWSCEAAREAGVRDEQIIVDPGIGFGKTWEQNLVLLRHLDALTALGLPILLGTSRKSFIGRLLDLPPEQRAEGTAASVALGIGKGADMVRVHDVAAMARVAKVADAIVRGP